MQGLAHQQMVRRDERRFKTQALTGGRVTGSIAVADGLRSFADVPRSLWAAKQADLFILRWLDDPAWEVSLACRDPIECGNDVLPNHVAIYLSRNSRTMQPIRY